MAFIAVSITVTGLTFKTKQMKIKKRSCDGFCPPLNQHDNKCAPPPYALNHCASVIYCDKQPYFLYLHLKNKISSFFILKSVEFCLPLLLKSAGHFMRRGHQI